MSEGWDKWLADLGTEPLGTVLHLGAGQGRLLETACNTAAARIVLVEPAPKDAAALARRAASDDRVTVLPAAVGPSTGRATLHQFNMAALSSLRAPGALREIFPGLRETASVEVDTLAPADLLDRLPPAGDRPDILLLETPGEEAEVLQGLIAADGLSRFRDIFLRAGRGAFYEGGAALPDLLALLRKEGFTPRRRSDADPDFPELHLRIEPVARENRALRAELAETRRRADAHEARITELDRALAEARDRADKARQDLSLALRLQSLRDADLAALEKKYADLLAQKESQDELLGKLTARLSSAARYLRQLDLAEVPGAEPQLEEPATETAKPARKTTATAGKTRARGRKTGGAT